ncbi:MAG: hypothetical protein Q7J30_01370 [Candidatus Azambacteria bacterium]|nr:hypothetical protein [Candidatus Azambacteria bacterium]
MLKKLLIKFEKKKAITAPIIKNGPKATWLFKVLRRDHISIIPKTAPITKAIVKAASASHGPKNNPIKSASLASPKPMAFPLEK